MAEDLSKIEIFSSAETFVFWNVEHYPIPSTADLNSIYRNLSSALEQMGLYGYLDINLYGEVNHGLKELYDAGMEYIPVAEAFAAGDSTESRMCMDIITHASVSQHDEPRNLVVIAKQNPESELHRVLHCLKSRNHIVLLVEPPDEGNLFHSVDSIVDRTQVLGGGKPISGSPQSSAHNDAVNEEDVNSSVMN